MTNDKFICIIINDCEDFIRLEDVRYLKQYYEDDKKISEVQTAYGRYDVTEEEYDRIARELLGVKEKT